MFEITYTKESVKTLAKMPRQIAARIQSKIEEIAAGPYGAHNNAKKLQGREGYRLRVGVWRVLYELNDGALMVLVVSISPRGGAYR